MTWAGGTAKYTLSLATYEGVGGEHPVEAVTATDLGVSEHRTPTMTAAGRSLVLSYWSDKSTATTAWTLPPNLLLRGGTTGSGAGRVSAALSDAAAVTASGGVGGQLGVTDATSSRGFTATVVLGTP